MAVSKSIPASSLVEINPGVIGAGGNPLSLNGVFLTTNAAIPVGMAMPFASAEDVATFFGNGSIEANMADVYFLGFDNSSTKPSSLFFAQYAEAPVAAYTRGASIAGKTLAQIQAIDESVFTANISASSNVMSVSAIASGVILEGQVIEGTGVTTDTEIVKQLSGVLGGVGTYQISVAQTFASTTVTGACPLDVVIDGVLSATASIKLSAATSYSGAAALLSTQTGQAWTYDTQRKAFVCTSGITGALSNIGYAEKCAATQLLITQATGAVLSQGSGAMTPDEVMTGVADSTQNWATFLTLFEPDTAGKTQFATWANSQNQRYLFVAWDSDPTAEQAGNTTCFGSLVQAANYNGVACVYQSLDIAAFVCGTAASINFQQHNGRITFAYKGQAGLTADVTNETVANNLIANGYNFYGAYATANDNFVFLQDGQVSGVWKWIDSYVNQIYLNNQLQLALMTLLANVNSLPYNNEGYSMIRAACQDPIAEALNFGSIRKGIPLSNQQAAQINMQSGIPIATTITTEGYYLQILPATAQVRGNRETPPITLWYADGSAIQQIKMSSIAVL